MEKEKVSPQELLEAGQTIQIKPIGHSMYPLLVEGRDAVVIAPINESRNKVENDTKQNHSIKLKRGDVVLYRREASILVIHRIWKAKKNGFYAVGDNQMEIEGPLDYSQIKGKMIAFVRNGKKISMKHPLYRVYSFIWLWLRPCRGKIGKTVHKIKAFKNF